MRDSREAGTSRSKLVPWIGAVLLAAAAAAWISFAGRSGEPGGAAIQVVIPRGASPAEVAEILEGSGVVRSALLFRLRTRLSGASERLQAGEYEFTGRVTPGEALQKLLTGDVVLHRLTLPEGITGAEVLERIAELGLAGKEDLEAAFADASPVRDLDPEAVDLEGYLFPDTYHLARPTPARQILGEMVARFRREITGELLGRARGLGLSLREAVTLASLIEKETAVPEERGRISAVFHNRLGRRMPLQCDPTVIYALASDGRYRGSLSREDLRYDSPYNTYVNLGLPPGPIASPGGDALQAAVAPQSVPDLYFVADGNGGHYFSRSLDDHIRAVERYRRLQRKGA